jgi:DNA polymerase-3 subunit alpha
MEAVAFPAVFKRFGSELKQGRILVLDGKLEERDGKRQFIIQSAADINEIRNEQGGKATLYLKISSQHQNAEHLNRLKTLLKRYKGSFQVILHYANLEKTVLLSEEYRVNGSDDCLSALEKFLGEKNVVLKN